MELPTDIYQVFPARNNGENFYTNPKTVRNAVRYRVQKHNARIENIKVFQVVGVAELGGLIWRDVTARFLMEVM